MTLKEKKIVLLVEDLYEDLEFWYPYYRLIETGAAVTVVGSGRKSEFESKHGYPAKADTDAGNVTITDYHGLIIPGGYAPDMMRRSEAMVELVRKAGEASLVVAAICHGGWMLASAGLIRNKKVTGFFAIKDDLINAGAEYLDQEVVRDGNIITSRMPSDLPAFCREIIETLQA